MESLTQEVLQDFADQVAEICETMELEPDQILQALGSTFIGAVMSFGKTDYQIEISGVAIAAVETIFESATE